MNIKFTLLVFLLIISLSSCYQRMYFPDRANSPGLKEALDTKITLAVKPQAANNDRGANGSSLSPSADIAFAPINHLGIIGSYRAVNNRYIPENIAGGIAPGYTLNDNDVLGGTYNDRRWEAGLGYFGTIEKHGIFEVYAGYGQGKVDRLGLYYRMYDFNSRYQRFFLQPAIGFDYDNISLTGGIRFAINRYTSFNSSDTSLRYIITSDGDTRNDVLTQNFGLIEPFVNFEVGYKYVKFNLQLGSSSPFLSNSVSGKFPIYATFGVALRFAPRYFK